MVLDETKHIIFPLAASPNRIKVREFDSSRPPPTANGISTYPSKHYDQKITLKCKADSREEKKKEKKKG